MTPADYREGARPYLERIQSYSESPQAFRERWDLRHFRFRPSSWIALVLPLARDFRRPQCVLCKEEAQRISARRLSGEEEVITACHHCRVFRVEEADSSALPL